METRICYMQEDILKVLSLIKEISFKGEDLEKIYMIKEIINNGQQVTFNLNGEGEV